MMTITEKVAYLKGLADGTKLDEATNEGKLLTAIIDVLDDIALTVADAEDTISELSQQIDEIDDDLAAIEEEWYEADEDEVDDEDDDDDGDTIYEVECPTCGDIICLDEDLAEEGAIECPNCGESLEFDFDDAEDCDCDCEDCNCGSKEVE